mmetsp:Transcript_19676/g.42808  ORF Transcript_19676/g.42808 Transcript_19676/m.42808 type:complete len:258 (+) Transcript_19676:139-912(+)
MQRANLLILSLQPAQGFSSLLCRTTLIRLILPCQQLLHLLLMFFELSLKFVRDLGIGKPQRKHLLLELSVREVEAAPDPTPVGTRIGLQLDARIERVIGDYLHRLFLTHEESQPLVFAVTEDAGLADAAFLPRFLARALVKHCFAILEEFRAVRTEDFLFFFASYYFDFFKFDHRFKCSRALLLLRFFLRWLLLGGLGLFGFGLLFVRHDDWCEKGVGGVGGIGCDLVADAVWLLVVWCPGAVCGAAGLVGWLCLLA